MLLFQDQNHLSLHQQITNLFFFLFSGQDWGASITHTCVGETQPVNTSTYPAGPVSQEAIVKNVLSSISKPVYLLDVTFLSQLRKDGHPSKYSGAKFDNDCTHWCLAGVPDTWNQLLYASMLQGKWEGNFRKFILFIIE